MARDGGARDGGRGMENQNQKLEVEMDSGSYHGKLLLQVSNREASGHKNVFPLLIMCIKTLSDDWSSGREFRELLDVWMEPSV